MAISGPVNTPGSSGFSTSGNGTSLTIACTGSTSGNQLYAFVAWGTTTGITASPSSGWTAVASGSNTQIYVTVYSRTATGSDSLTVTFSASVTRAALAAYEISGSGYGVSAFNTANQAPGPSATPPVASQCFSIYAFAGTFATPSLAGVSTNPTVGTYDGVVSGGTASSYTIALAFSHLASTSGSASKITWSNSPGYECNAQIILAPLIATTSQTKTSTVTAKLKASATAVSLATSIVSASTLALSKAVSAASSALAAAVSAQVSASQSATLALAAGRLIASVRVTLAAASAATGRITASVRASAASATSSLTARSSLTQYLRAAVTSTLSSARGIRASAKATVTSALTARTQVAVTLAAQATSAATAARSVVLVVAARATSTVSAAYGLLTIVKSIGTSAAAARTRATATIGAKATSVVSARVTAALRFTKAAPSTVSAGFRSVVTSRAVSATSVVSPARSLLALARSAATSTVSTRTRAATTVAANATSALSARATAALRFTRAASSLLGGSFRATVMSKAVSATSALTASAKSVITVSRSATSAAHGVRAALTMRATFHATSTVHAAAGVVLAIVRSATTTLTAVRGSFFFKIFARATSALKALFLNTSDTIGQDEVCYAIEDALLQLFTQAQKPGGKLAAASQYAPVTIVEHVVPPEQRIFPNVAVQFRRLEVTPSGLNREDVTATYDISVAVQQPYKAGNPATIGNARAILSPYVDDGAGNGVIEILRANPTLGGLCRRSKVVALEEATLQTASATGGAIVAAFIVLECDYPVTVA